MVFIKRFFPILLSLAQTVSVSCAEDTRVGPSGFLIRDGTPLFVIGAYALPKGMDAKGLASMGFNVLHIGKDPSEWKACEEAGLFIWNSLDLEFSGPNVEAKKTSVRAMVEAQKNDPNLLIWETIDEPAWSEENPEEVRIPPEPLIAGYRFLKQLDPHHPVYLNQAPRNTIEVLRKYNTAADIQCVDVYPVIPPGLRKMYAIMTPTRAGGVPRQTDLPDLSPACVGDYVDKMKRVAYDNQAVFVVLQGFAWEALRPKAEQDPSLILYPDFEELRFMAYQAIVHGANGIMIFGLQFNDNEKNLSDLSKVLNEVRGFEGFILGHRVHSLPSLRYKGRGYTIAKGIECLVTETPEAATLFAVNASIDPATVQFSSLPDPFDEAEELDVVGEGRKVSLKTGKFEEDFEGLGVHIYQFLK